LIWGNHLVTQSELYILKVEEFELIWGNGSITTKKELFIPKVQESQLFRSTNMCLRLYLDRSIEKIKKRNLI
jgi:hypothetical protein